MKQLEHKDLLDAGVHFGHMTRKWDPAMSPYIFMEKNGIHLIDLHKTIHCIHTAASALKDIVQSGRKILFVATKTQAKKIVQEEAIKLNMPYVTERWLGGMLTNFSTIKKSMKKLARIEKMMGEESYKNLAKRERLMVQREKEKLTKLLGGISNLMRLPAALFVVDIKREHIAIAEAQKLNITVCGIVDTNSNPNLIDYPIPGNDDSLKAIKLITSCLSNSIEEGISERRKVKEAEKVEREAKAKEEEKGDGKKTHEQKASGTHPAKKETAKKREENTKIADKSRTRKRIVNTSS